MEMCLPMYCRLSALTFLGYERKGVDGIACQRTYVTDAKLDGQKVKPGDVVGLLYNRWGKVEEITVEANA